MQNDKSFLIPIGDNGCQRVLFEQVELTAGRKAVRMTIGIHHRQFNAAEYEYLLQGLARLKLRKRRL